MTSNENDSISSALSQTDSADSDNKINHSYGQQQQCPIVGKGPLQYFSDKDDDSCPCHFAVNDSENSGLNSSNGSGGR
eukprot:15366164-Ditylum_brightwellii.AAC.1